MPGFITPQFVTSAIVIITVLHVILICCAYLVLLERKVMAWIQDRVGPNRVGPAGLLQPFADIIKLMLKEEFFPKGADRWLFMLAPFIVIILALIGFAVIPFGGELDLSTLPFGLAETLGVSGVTVNVIAANVNIGLIYIVAVTSLGVYGVVLGGWASNSKFPFFGSLRASAQMISYEIPMGLAILSIVLFSGTIMPNEMVKMQLEGGSWFILQQPLAAILFYICMLAENNRAPFDMAEADSELVGGYHTEYSSMKFILFYIAEYVHMVVGSAFFAVMFLGGWSLNPTAFGPDLPYASTFLMVLLQFVIFMAKVIMIIYLTMVVRWTLPRFRFDQLMRLAWEGLIPTGLFILLVTSFMVYFGWQEWMWAASLVMLVVIWLVRPLMPQQAEPNHRLPLIGSRFSPLKDIDEITQSDESVVSFE